MWSSKLAQLGQSHLLAEGVDQDAVFRQLDRVELNYPGGVAKYLENARALLKSAANSENPYDGFVPSMPPCITIDTDAKPEELLELDKEGRSLIGKCGFVLVAGGLGERLGYPDIKVKLFTQVTEEMTYIEYYCRSIVRCQQVAASLDSKTLSDVRLPFFIMTSGDTHDRTVAFMEENKYFGLDPSQVYIRQQEKVPALENSDAKIAFSSGNSTIETKPHGHGDVHLLLYTNNLLKEFKEKYGTEWLFFFQDTNCLSFRVLHPMLAISKQQNFAMNSLTIPRLPCEAMGAICKLTKETGDASMVLNVEYNQLDALLKASGEEGDVAYGSSGMSKYPGNCNILLFNLDKYAAVLDRSHGHVPEFVNPKYTDNTKTSFKSPTRVESMMQEIPRLFNKSEIHGCTIAPRWLCFSTVKNNCEDAAKRVTPECAFSAEQDLYSHSRQVLEMCLGKQNVNYEAPIPTTYNGVTYPAECRVWISPESCVSITDVKEALESKKISQVQLNHNSCFKITPSSKCETVPMPAPVPISENDTNVADNYKVRGYKMV